MAETPSPQISWLEHSQKLREAFDFGYRSALANSAKQGQEQRAAEMEAHLEKLQSLMEAFRQDLELILSGPLADEQVEAKQGFWREIDPAEEWAEFLAQQMREEEQ